MALPDGHVERIFQKYRLHPDGWSLTLPAITQLMTETPWSKVLTPGLVRLKDEDGDDEVHVRAFDNSLTAVMALVRGEGTPASPTAISEDAVLGQYQFKGQRSTTLDDTVVGAELRAEAAADFSEGGASASWTQIGGDGVDSSWNFSGWVRDTVEVGSDVYAATAGESSGTSELWRWRSDAWTMVGGDGVNSSWTASAVRDSIYTLETNGTVVYVGLGHEGATSAGGAVWELTPDTTWVEIGAQGDFDHGSHRVAILYRFGGVLYAGLLSTGAHTGMLESYDGTAGNWTSLINAPNTQLPGSLFFQQGISGIAANGTTMYIATHCTGGTTHGSRVFSATIGTWVWTEIGGDGTNSSWTDTGVGRTMLWWINGKLHAYFTPNTGQIQVWEFDGASTWTKIGGDGVNNSWDSSQDAAARRPDGGLTADGTYLYAQVAGDTSEGGVWQRPLAGGDWEHIAGNAQNSSWDNGDATSGGKPRVWSSVLYGGTGGSADEAELWTTPVGAGRSTNLFISVAQGDTLSDRMKFSANGDIALGLTLSEIVWDESASSLAIAGKLTTTGNVEAASQVLENSVRVTTAAAAITDNALVRGDGGSNSLQDTGLLVSDTDDLSGLNSMQVAGANGATSTLLSATEELTGLSGANVTTTGLIPAGAFDVHVVVRVTTLIEGATDFDIGDGSDVDTWGAGIAVAADTVTDQSDWTVGPLFHTAASEVVLTANGSNFTAGAVRVVVFYRLAAGPTS